MKIQSSGCRNQSGISSSDWKYTRTIICIVLDRGRERKKRDGFNCFNFRVNCIASRKPLLNYAFLPALSAKLIRARANNGTYVQTVAKAERERMILRHSIIAKISKPTSHILYSSCYRYAKIRIFAIIFC